MVGSRMVGSRAVGNLILADTTTRSHVPRFDGYSTNVVRLQRIFSLMGLLPTVNPAQLQPDIIGASMEVGSWDKEGVIRMVDGQLKRLQKEGIV